MSGSSSIVNYNVRPCKSIERKMMCELIARLGQFEKISEYRYVGLGAKYFADFVLMHKQFGITNMLSMEKHGSVNNRLRFDFNKPFNCIDVKFGDAHSLLNSNQFSWKKRTVVWLDYDGGFTGKQIETLQTCIKKLPSGSMVFLTTNADFGEAYNNGGPKDKREIFSKRVGNDNYIAQLKIKDFAGNGIYGCIQNVLNVMVEDTLSERNLTITKPEDTFHCDQIAYFKYADSAAPMITLGWVVYSQSEHDQRNKCDFEQFEFCNSTGKPYDISVPNFTYKELAVLNRNMPNVSFPIKEAPFFEEEEVDEYKRIYRYYPTTIETNIIL